MIELYSEVRRDSGERDLPSVRTLIGEKIGAVMGVDTRIVDGVMLTEAGKRVHVAQRASMGAPSQAFHDAGGRIDAITLCG